MIKPLIIYIDEQEDNFDETGIYENYSVPSGKMFIDDEMLGSGGKKIILRKDKPILLKHADDFIDIFHFYKRLSEIKDE